MAKANPQVRHEWQDRILLEEVERNAPGHKPDNITQGQAYDRILQVYKVSNMALSGYSIL